MPRKTSKSTEPKKGAPRAKKNGVVDAAASADQPDGSAQPASPTPEEIRTRAYEIFRSGTNRDPVADWFQAEQELRSKITA